MADYYSGKGYMNGAAHFSCSASEKIDFLRELMELNIPLTDIEVNDPSLEQVFLALTKGEDLDNE